APPGDERLDGGLGEDGGLVGFVLGFAVLGPGFVRDLGLGGLAGRRDLFEEGDRVGSDGLVTWECGGFGSGDRFGFDREAKVFRPEGVGVRLLGRGRLVVGRGDDQLDPALRAMDDLAKLRRRGADQLLALETAKFEQLGHAKRLPTRARTARPAAEEFPKGTRAMLDRPDPRVLDPAEGGVTMEIVRTGNHPGSPEAVIDGTDPGARTSRMAQ